MIKDSEIIVIDNVSDSDYQEQIRSILLGEVNYGDYEFPWYYTKDITTVSYTHLTLPTSDLV